MFHLAPKFWLCLITLPVTKCPFSKVPSLLVWPSLASTAGVVVLDILLPIIEIDTCISGGRRCPLYYTIYSIFLNTTHKWKLYLHTDKTIYTYKYIFMCVCVCVTVAGPVTWFCHRGTTHVCCLGQKCLQLVWLTVLNLFQFLLIFSHLTICDLMN